MALNDAIDSLSELFEPMLILMLSPLLLTWIQPSLNLGIFMDDGIL